MKEDKKELRTAMLLLSIMAMFPVVLDYLILNGFFAFKEESIFEDGIRWIYEAIAPDMMMFRGISFVFVACAFSLVIPMVSLELRQAKKKKVPLNALLLLPFLGGYIYGFTGDVRYDVFMIPFYLFFVVYFSGQIFPYLFQKMMTMEKDVFKKLPKAEKHHKGFVFKADSGTIDMPMPHTGILTQGSQRSGKTASWGEPVIYQSIMSGHAAYIYDYKGNEHPLTTCALAAWENYKKKNKDGNVPTFDIISILNPLFLTRKVNPIEPRYMKSYPFCKGICEGFYKNLDTSSIKNFDFWAKNGLSIIANTAYFLKENYPSKCSLPYLITFLLQDLEDLLALLSTDRILGYRMRAVLGAYKKQAHSQIAGIQGSLQTILDTMFSPEIFWALHDDKEDYIDLRVNDPKNPKVITVLNNEAIPEVLTPIIGAIDSTVILLMNDNQDFHPCLISFDEIPTKYVKDLDFVPATMASKKVILHILYQEESQIIAKYGDVGARKLLNMGNQIFCRSNDSISSKKVAEMFGEYDKIRHTQTVSDSGISISETTEKRKRVTQEMVETQPVGHSGGKIMGADPNLFWTQMKEGSIDKLLNVEKSALPKVGMPGIKQYIETDDKELAEKVLSSLMKMQFERIINDVEDIMAPYKEEREEREMEEAENSKKY